MESEPSWFVMHSCCRICLSLAIFCTHYLGTSGIHATKLHSCTLNPIHNNPHAAFVYLNVINWPRFTQLIQSLWPLIPQISTTIYHVKHRCEIVQSVDFKNTLSTNKQCRARISSSEHTIVASSCWWMNSGAEQNVRLAQNIPASMWMLWDSTQSTTSIVCDKN